jgi:hypothetical protein
MDINQLIDAASADPQFDQAMASVEPDFSDVAPEQLDELIQMLEFALQNPEQYAQVRMAAITDDMADPEDLPEQFDAALLSSVLVVLKRLKSSAQQPMAMARGGLAAVRDLSRRGRFGDTMLAHINPEEAAMLRMRGGAGTINPNTGLPQYFSLKKLFKAILPIAINFIAPGLGSAIGAALGATGAAASALGGAIIGGVSSKLTGGNVVQGALMGGLGGGLSNVVGKGVSNTLGLGLGDTGQAILGGSLVGAGAGVATGQGALRGALQGAVGSGVSQFAGNMAGSTATQQGISAGGQTFGQALTAGYDPKTAAAMGGLSGLATGLTYGTRPSQAVLENMEQVTLPDGTVAPVPGTEGMDIQGRPGVYQLDPATGAVNFVNKPGSYQVNPQTGAVEWSVQDPSFLQKITGRGQSIPAVAGQESQGGGNLLKNLALGATVLGAVAPAISGEMPPPAVQQAVQQLAPEQQEYFNRPSVVWDWNKLQQDAAASNQSLSRYMAQNWPTVTSGAYSMQQPPVAMQQGGPLSAVARFARGAGTGRSDEIDAKLSDGEFVMDAETVAMLGDGSSKAGADKLEQMRREIRSHKGKAMAKGKFSPNAKSPLAYIKGVA